MDVQAQDRAHRIGQTKPVLIFRLVSAHTIETKIMEKANEKRKLEALVIAKGLFCIFRSRAFLTVLPTQANSRHQLWLLHGARLRKQKRWSRWPLSS
jgi:hypothetical protein